MKFTAIYPDQTKKILLSLPNYVFHWQRRYSFKEPEFLPAGTKILAEGLYDNSRHNPDNPDHRAEVTFGTQSEDEMFSGFLFFVEK